MKMAVIGAGMMGSAIVKGIVNKNVLKASDIFISDAMSDKVKQLHDAQGTSCAASNLDAVSGADVVLIAVKPQFLADVSAEIKGHIPADALLMTIVVGVPTSYYPEAMGAQRIIRIMPNTPAQVGEGVCAWYAAGPVSAEQKKLAEKILSALGMQFEAQRESMLDLVTAVSGSGPAYVFLFIEAMTDTAVHMGIPRQIAQQIALQTVLGSAEYMKQSGKHPVILKNEVTSPGGTTAEALAVMEKEGLRTALADGMWACLKRTIELGKK